MPDSQVEDQLKLFESFSKLFAIGLGTLYLFGFLVVASHLSRYGVSTFSVLQLEYLIAGTWALGPPLIYALIMFTSRRFDERAAPERPGKFNWRRFAISSLLTGIPSMLFVGVLAALPGVFESVTWGIAIRFFLFYVALTSCAQIFWISCRVEPSKETPMVNRSHAAPFYFVLFLMIVIAYAVWFSVRIYPLIPFSLGGGRPLSVAFFEGGKKMPDEIVKLGPASKTSIPYKLLLTTDRSYIVVSPSDKERSLEISRDSVAGMVVLQ